MKHLFLFLCIAITGVTLGQNQHMIAENYFRNNEFEKAATIFKKLVNKSQYNTNYLSRLVACYQEIDSFSTADTLLKQKLKKTPKLTYLNVLIGYNFERQHQTEKADTYYQKALSSITENANYGSTIASFFKKYNKLDFAIQAYKSVEKKLKNANYGFQIAQIYGEKGDFEQMFEQYINYVDKNKRHLNTVKRYAAKYVTDDAENENNTLFKKALLRRSVNNPKEVWNNLLSWLFTKQKQYKKAFIQQKALFARNADNLSGIKALGTIAFENEAYETAAKCFDFFSNNTSYPNDKMDAIAMNLRIAIKTKQPDVAIKFQDFFTEYGVNSNTVRSQLVYANYLTFDKNDVNKAIQVLEKALEVTRNKRLEAVVKLKLGEVLVYQGKFNKALRYFSQVQTKFKNSYLADEARFKVAQTSYFKNDFKWAKAQLKVLKGASSKLIANDAANLFLTVSDNQPKDSLPTGLAKYAKADLLAYQHKNKEAIALLSEIIVEFKAQPIEDEALFKQAELYIQQKEYTKAISNFNKLIQLDAKGIYVDDTYYQLAKLHETKLNSTEKAQEYYQKIIFDHSNSIYLVDARKQYRKLRGDTVN